MFQRSAYLLIAIATLAAACTDDLHSATGDDAPVLDGGVGDPSCDDHLKNGDETGIDCGGSCDACAPTPSCDDHAMNGNETGIDCGGSCDACEPVPTCDDHVMNGTETGVDCGGSCDACAPTPSCDDHVMNGNETGVDCGGSCGACAPTPSCDDHVMNGNETGVDCGGSCTACEPAPTCGNGVLDPREQCDDGNTAIGDGCNAACKFEFVGCAPGDGMLVVSGPSATIPDGTGLTATSALGIDILDQGAVHKVAVGIGSLRHAAVGELTLELVSPTGKTRILSSRNGGNGHDFRGTRFEDFGATSIGGVSPAAAPFASSFRPQESLSAFRQTNSGGIWRLNVFDSVAGHAGVLDSWTLALCVDPTAVCGNGHIDAGEQCDGTADCSAQCQLDDGCGDGNLDAGEQCDDGNTFSGDGCSASCHLDISCELGETAVIVADNVSHAIPDNSGPGAIASVVVPTVGAVTKIIVATSVTHGRVGDIALLLGDPHGRERGLAVLRGGDGANFRSTIFSDRALRPIATAAAPFTGTFRPDQSLAFSASDFFANNAAGTWTLNALDIDAGIDGTLDSFSLAMCVNPWAAYCGDGIANGFEQCDDGNSVGDDACSNQCRTNEIHF